MKLRSALFDGWIVVSGVVLGVVSGVAGCSSPKHAAAPAMTNGGSERCRKAAERLVELMSASSAAEPDAIKEITDKVAGHCDSDGWDEKTTNCISTLPDKDHLTGCEPMFTDAQKQKLVEAFDSTAAGAPKNERAGAPPAPGAAPPAQPSSAMPSPAPAPPRSKSDPCEGGQ